MRARRQHLLDRRVATALETRKTRRPLRICVACKITNRAHGTHAMADQDNFVPITGVARVFLDIRDRHVFIPANCMSTAARVFVPGETVAIEVLRRYAKQEGVRDSAIEAAPFSIAPYISSKRAPYW
jgi:hypothetical protein